MNLPTDQLAERLRELPLEVPRPDVIAARVLAAAKQPEARWRIARRHGRTPAFLPIAAAFLVLVLGSWGVLYFSPATAAALADASGAGSFPSEMLDHFGLGSKSITAESSSSTSSGYKVQLIGAYADSIRTVVLLRFSPAAFVSGYPQLTDQFGISYPQNSAEGNLLTGDQVVSFEPAFWLTSVTGMRFTVTMNEVQLLGGQTKVSGTWTVKGVVLFHNGTALQTPGSGSLGPGRVTFVEARYVNGAVSIKAEVQGVALGGIVPAVGPGTKPQPALSVGLAPADGGPLKPANEFESSSSGDSTELQMLFLKIDPGRYFVVITLAGAGTLQSPLVVR